MKIFLINITLNFLLFYNVKAQNFAIEKFVGTSELPTNELYTMVEDSRGVKWLASDGGLIKIIGKDIKVLTVKDGLQETVVLGVFEGFNDEIWYCTMGGYIGYFRNDSLFSLPRSNQQLQALMKQKLAVTHFGFDQNKTFLTLNHRELVEIDSKSDRIKAQLLVDSFNAQFIIYPKGQAILFYPNSAQLINTANIKISDAGKPTYSLKLQEEGLFTPRLLTKREQNYFFSIGTKLFRFKDNVIKSFELNAQIIALTTLVDGKVFVGCLDGIRLIIGDNVFHMPDFKYSVSSLFFDSENTLWISTLEDGLYFVKDTKTKLNFQTKNVIRAFTSNPKQLEYVLDYHHVLSATNDTVYKLYSYKMSQRIYDKTDVLINNRNRQVVSMLAYDMPEWDGKTDLVPQLAYKFYPITTRTFLNLSVNKLTLLNADLKKVDSINLRDKPVSALFPDTNTALVAYYGGLYKAVFHNGKFQKHGDIYDKRVVCMDTIGQYFIIGTADYGVKMMDVNGKLIRNLPQFPMRVEQIKHYQNYIIAHSKKNLYLFNLLNNTIKIFNQNNLIPFSNINFLKVLKDTVWLANNRSVIAMPIEDLIQYQPKLKINCQFDLKTFSVYNFQITKGSDQYLKIDIQNYSTKAFSSSQYFITTIRNNEFYKIDSTERLTFETILPHGQYNIMVQAIDKSTRSKSNSVVLNFNIPKVFYETWWFIALVILFNVMFIYLVIKWRISNVRRIEKEKRDILSKVTLLEAESLQSQMNPHFIFNAINSIQEFILRNDIIKAQSYLADFAKLIRLVLNHNRLKKVTLADEVSLLELYVKLESLRLKSSIRLKIQPKKNIDLNEILLPAMLLQPIIENAIWHGLKQSTKEKEIVIKFELQLDKLHICILDNGIGIQNMQKIYQSHALNIIKKRLEILNAKAEGVFSIKNREDATGVEVNLILPLIEKIKEHGSEQYRIEK